jgi:pimeloyl-ACP methyl ester carboxylesterase
MGKQRQRLAILVMLAAASAWMAAARHSFADDPKVEEFLFPAKDVDAAVLKSGDRVKVEETDAYWHLAPAKDPGPRALLFVPGGGVEATAYAPLLRTVAEKGTRVFLVKLPGKPESPEKQKRLAVEQGQEIIKSQADVKGWVVGGHSLGGATAALFVHEQPQQFRGLILIATTHPRDFDLSGYAGDVTKVYGTQDNVAKFAQSEANKKLLPAETHWVRIEGGNHAQFGNYGRQFGDGKATISREEQQNATVAALVEAMERVAERPRGTP